MDERDQETCCDIDDKDRDNICDTSCGSYIYNQGEDYLDMNYGFKQK